MDAAERKEIMSRYADHQRRFEAVAARRQNGPAEVIPFSGPLRELEQEPTMREIEVLQLISDGLEAALMVHVAAQDFLALCGVHAWAIGGLAKPL